MHIAERIDMYHQGNRRDDDEHHHRNRIEQDAEVEMQTAQRKPCEIVRHNRGERTVSQTIGGKIGEGCHIAHQRHHTQRTGADESCRLMRHLHTRKSQNEERDQWHEQDQD